MGLRNATKMQFQKMARLRVGNRVVCFRVALKTEDIYFKESDAVSNSEDSDSGETRDFANEVNDTVMDEEERKGRMGNTRNMGAFGSSRRCDG